MKAILITITIALLITVSPAQDQVTVPCVKDKCAQLELFNKIIDLRNREDDDLKQLEQSLIHEPPGYVVSLDRQATVAELIKKGEAAEALYKDALDLARQRTAAYRKMLNLEQK